MKKEIVSIIVPIYNSANYLPNTLESIINQTYKNIEILLIDDGSTDNSLDICYKYSKKDKRIKVKHHSNHGVSYTRNQGIEFSTGDFIFFCDADDYLDNNCIEELINAHKTGGVAKLNYKLIFTKNIKKIEFSESSAKDFVQNIINGLEDGYCWGYLYEKDKINKLRFCENTSFMEDTIFLIEYLKNVDKIFIANNCYYNYINNFVGISSPTKNIEKKLNDAILSLEIIEKNVIGYLSDAENIINLKINKKKIIIIEYLMQNCNFKLLKKIFSIPKIKEIARDAKNNKLLNIRYKIFGLIIYYNLARVMLLYIKIRKILKRVVKKHE